MQPSEFVFDTYRDASDVLNNLREMIEKYDSATVGDFYELVGIPSDFFDQKYGWNDLPEYVRIHRAHGGGWVMDIPRPAILYYEGPEKSRVDYSSVSRRPAPKSGPTPYVPHEKVLDALIGNAQNNFSAQIQAYAELFMKRTGLTPDQVEMRMRHTVSGNIVSTSVWFERKEEEKPTKAQVINNYYARSNPKVREYEQKKLDDAGDWESVKELLDAYLANNATKKDYTGAAYAVVLEDILEGFDHPLMTVFAQSMVEVQKRLEKVRQELDYTNETSYLTILNDIIHEAEKGMEMIKVREILDDQRKNYGGNAAPYDIFLIRILKELDNHRIFLKKIKRESAALD